MATINERIEQLEKELNELKEEVKNQNVASDAFLKSGEAYSYIYGDGSIDKDVWASVEIDLKRLAIGNVFKTEDEANEMVERLKLLKFAKDCGGHMFETAPKFAFTIGYDAANKCITRIRIDEKK